MEEVSWVFLSFLTCIHLCCFLLIELRPLWEPGVWAYGGQSIAGISGRKAQTSKPSPSSWFCFSFLHLCFEFPGLFIVIFDDLNVFRFFNSILFLFNPWMNYFYHSWKLSPHVWYSGFIQVLFSLCCSLFPVLEAFSRYLHPWEFGTCFKVRIMLSGELWVHRGLIEDELPYRVAYTVWEPSGCRIFIHPGLWVVKALES